MNKLILLVLTGILMYAQDINNVYFHDKYFFESFTRDKANGLGKFKEKDFIITGKFKDGIAINGLQVYDSKGNYLHEWNSDLIYVMGIYKDSYNKLTFNEIEYLKKNLKKIISITRKFLNKYSLPKMDRASGKYYATFDFILDKNCSRSIPTKSSGSDILDKHYMDIIMKSCEQYPKPKRKTKIRLNFQYLVY